MVDSPFAHGGQYFGDGFQQVRLALFELSGLAAAGETDESGDGFLGVYGVDGQGGNVLGLECGDYFFMQGIVAAGVNMSFRGQDGFDGGQFFVWNILHPVDAWADSIVAPFPGDACRGSFLIVEKHLYS